MFHALMSEQENQDPRKISSLIELMMDNPLNGDGGSFGDSRLVTWLTLFNSLPLSLLRFASSNFRERISCRQFLV